MLIIHLMGAAAKDNFNFPCCHYYYDQVIHINGKLTTWAVDLDATADGAVVFFRQNLSDCCRDFGGRFCWVSLL